MSDVRAHGEGTRRPAGEGRRGWAIHTKLGGFSECAKADSEETKHSRVLTRNRMI